MSEKSADEQPKKKIARQVVTQKRQYFVPEHNVTVEATDADDAVKQAKALDSQTEEDGDG